MNEQILLTPGPTPIPPESLAEEAKPIIHHRTKEFGDIFQEAQVNLQYIFQTQEKVFTLTSSGTGGMECAVVNLISPGMKVIVASIGAFGERWIKILSAFGANVVPVRAEWGYAVKPAELSEALAKNPDAKIIFSTLTDTSTAVACDIKAYGEITAKSNVILVVDAISGLGGQEVHMDDWGVDALVSASQKGLMAAPGLGFISFSKKAWPFVLEAKAPRFYWDIRTIEKAFHNSETPFTPAISLLRATNASMRIIKKMTMPAVWKQARDLAKYTRDYGKSLDLELFPKDPCDVLTSFNVPQGVDGKKIVQDILDKYNISIAGGQEKLAGKVVRIAHMGFIQRNEIEKGMKALGEFLKAQKVVAAAS